MNYEKIYNQIINRAKNRILECYTEKHHKRACIIDGVWYKSIREASNQLGIKWDMVSDRIKSKSEKFKNWNYAE